MEGEGVLLFVSTTSYTYTCMHMYSVALLNPSS